MRSTTTTPAVPPFRVSATRPAVVRLGKLALASRYTLAPLAGYTGLAFRRAVRELGGVGLATTDLVNTRALVMRSARTLQLIATCPEDTPFAVQVFGADAGDMVAAARWLVDYGVDSLDVNMGCPVHKVTRSGGGSAMLCDPDGTVGLVARLVEAIPVPVTVKMRLGWDDDHRTAPAFAREFEKVGVAAVTIHGRTREQGFGGQVKLDGIKAVVEAVESMLVFGNGDVRTIADAAHMLETTGCAGIAIGRGALRNPWFFTQLQRWEQTGDPGPPATYAERLGFMERHFRLLVEYIGEHLACLTYRKFATYYCKGLGLGHDLQQQLVMLESVARFEELAEEIRAIIAPRGDDAWHEAEVSVRVPKGPIEHW